MSQLQIAVIVTRICIFLNSQSSFNTKFMSFPHQLIL